MLSDKTTFRILIALAFVFLISCKSKKEITKQEIKEETKTEVDEKASTTSNQQVQTINQIIASTDENSQLTIIRYDTEKPITADGKPPVVEVIYYTKNKKETINKSESIKANTEERSDYKSESTNHIQKREQQTNEPGTNTKRTGIPLPFCIFIVATATAGTILLIRKSKSKLAMGIASRIRNFLSLLRKK